MNTQETHPHVGDLNPKSFWRFNTERWNAAVDTLLNLPGGPIAYLQQIDNPKLKNTTVQSLIDGSLHVLLDKQLASDENVQMRAAIALGAAILATPEPVVHTGVYYPIASGFVRAENPERTAVLWQMTLNGLKAYDPPEKTLRDAGFYLVKHMLTLEANRLQNMEPLLNALIQTEDQDLALTGILGYMHDIVSSPDRLEESEHAIDQLKQFFLQAPEQMRYYGLFSLRFLMSNHNRIIGAQRLKKTIEEFPNDRTFTCLKHLAASPNVKTRLIALENMNLISEDSPEQNVLGLIQTVSREPNRKARTYAVIQLLTFTTRDFSDAVKSEAKLAMETLLDTSPMDLRKFFYESNAPHLWENSDFTFQLLKKGLQHHNKHVRHSAKKGMSFLLSNMKMHGVFNTIDKQTAVVQTIQTLQNEGLLSKKVASEYIRYVTQAYEENSIM